VEDRGESAVQARSAEDELQPWKRAAYGTGVARSGSSTSPLWPSPTATLNGLPRQDLSDFPLLSLTRIPQPLPSFLMWMNTGIFPSESPRLRLLDGPVGA
jgi:hypothetical protein